MTGLRNAGMRGLGELLSCVVQQYANAACTCTIVHGQQLVYRRCTAGDPYLVNTGTSSRLGSWGGPGLRIFMELSLCCSLLPVCTELYIVSAVKVFCALRYLFEMRKPSAYRKLISAELNLLHNSLFVVIR